MKRPPNNRGFALAEVLVASGILCAACLALAGGLRNSMRSIYRAQEEYRAALRLEGAIWDIDQSGKTMPLNLSEHWTEKGTPVEKVESGDLFNEVWESRSGFVFEENVVENQVRLSWGNPQRKESLVLATYQGVAP